MASTLLPSAGDQENRMLHGHVKAKSFSKLGYNASAKKAAFTTPQKQLLLPGNKSIHQSLGRTFGDISNRLSDRSTGTTPALKQAGKSVLATEGIHRALQQQQHSTEIKTKPEPTFAIADVERDFFPIITEVEDYSDILPPSLVLDYDAIQRLIHPWLMMQSSTCEQKDFFNSTAPSLDHEYQDLLELDDYRPMMPGAGGYLLKPVFEDPVPSIFVDW